MATINITARLRACVSLWPRRNLARLAGGFSSDVFACTTAGGSEVVLKLGATAEEAQREAAALRVWAASGGGVHLLDADIERDALLLGRIRPGTRLPGDDEPGAIQVAAHLLTRLHQVSPGTFPFPALEERYLDGERRSRQDATSEQRVRGEPSRGVSGLQRLPEARAVALHLCVTTRQPVRLHGDFLDKNLLWNGSGYVAIDPIPCTGDPCADVVLFAAEHPPAAGILSRSAAIAARIGLDSCGAQRWAAVWTVLLATSARRADQAELEACLSHERFERLLAG